jgi:hypothetical protein
VLSPSQVAALEPLLPVQYGQRLSFALQRVCCGGCRCFARPRKLLSSLSSNHRSSMPFAATGGSVSEPASIVLGASLTDMTRIQCQCCNTTGAPIDCASVYAIDVATGACRSLASLAQAGRAPSVAPRQQHSRANELVSVDFSAGNTILIALPGHDRSNAANSNTGSCARRGAGSDDAALSAVGVAYVVAPGQQPSASQQLFGYALALLLATGSHVTDEQGSDVDDDKGAFAQGRHMVGYPPVYFHTSICCQCSESKCVQAYCPQRAP